MWIVSIFRRWTLNNQLLEIKIIDLLASWKNKIGFMGCEKDKGSTQNGLFKHRWNYVSTDCIAVPL